MSGCADRSFEGVDREEQRSDHDESGPVDQPGGRSGGGPTGEEKAAANRAVDPPA